MIFHSKVYQNSHSRKTNILLWLLLKNKLTLLLIVTITIKNIKMQKYNAPFALGSRIRQAIILIVILSPLYTYIIINTDTTPTVMSDKTLQLDSIASDTTKKDSFNMAPFYR